MRVDDYGDLNISLVQGQPLWQYLTYEGFSYLAFLQGQWSTHIRRPKSVPSSRSRARSRLRKLFLSLVTFFSLCWMAIFRRRVLISGNDIATPQGPYDARMAGVYNWLKKSARHGHLIHSTYGRGSVGHWWRRARPALYYETFEALARFLLKAKLARPVFDLPSNVDAEQAWMTQRATIVATTVKILKFVFNLIRPGQIWLIDDGRFWHQLVLAARQAQVPTVLFQHGRFNRHIPAQAYKNIPAELIPVPDQYIVWNDFWKRQLLAISPPFALHPEVVRPGGSPGRVSLSQKTQRGGQTIVIIHEPVVNAEPSWQAIIALVALKDYHFVYKVRADRPIKEQLAPFRLQELVDRGELEVVEKMPEQVGLVVGAYSTLLYECLAAGAPVAVLKLPTLEAEDLVQAGLAEMLDPTSSDLDQQIQRAIAVQDGELARRAKTLAVDLQIEETLTKLIHG